MDFPGNIYFKENIFYVRGNWTKAFANSVQKQIVKLQGLAGHEALVDTSRLGELDTTGALLLEDFLKHLRRHWLHFELAGLKPNHKALLDLIASKEMDLAQLPSEPAPPTFFEVIGQETFNKLKQLEAYLAFTGQFIVMFLHSLVYFTPLQTRTFLNSIDEMGFRALPIIALLSFLVGVVLAYQLGMQLQNYGANAFVVNLVGQAVLREFGPLITAIIGAGRTSAAITAQLGTMKINEEIDALKTMGLSPFDVLVVPRVIAALVAFPLLMVWADIFGVMGGMIMTKAFFGMQYGDFLGRFRDVIDVHTLIIGLVKAPAFAVIIAMVGCFQGLHVSTSADSVGIQTTKAVVQAIFLIIIADSLYALLNSKLFT
jgi:phospholipid/cholesterol/gamma-HCH transport system permease protein